MSAKKRLGLNLKWEDTTSYSQGGSREPRAWTAKIYDVRVTIVKCPRDYPEHAWKMWTSKLEIEKPLPGITDIEDAKVAAVTEVLDYAQGLESACYGKS